VQLLVDVTQILQGVIDTTTSGTGNDAESEHALIPFPISNSQPDPAVTGLVVVVVGSGSGE